MTRRKAVSRANGCAGWPAVRPPPILHAFWQKDAHRARRYGGRAVGIQRVALAHWPAPAGYRSQAKALRREDGHNRQQ